MAFETTPHPNPRQPLPALPSTASSRRGLPPTSMWAYVAYPCARLPQGERGSNPRQRFSPSPLVGEGRDEG